MKKTSDRKKGADKDRARVERAAARRRGRPKSGNWKPPTAAMAKRAGALLGNHTVDATEGNLILATLIVQHIDVVDCLYDQSIVHSVEMRQLSTMVSAGKRVETLLEKLGIAGEIGPKDLVIPGMGGTPATSPVKKKAKKKAAAKKKATKKKPAAKTKKAKAGASKKKLLAYL